VTALSFAAISVGSAIDSLLHASLDTTRVTDEGSTRTVMIVSGGLVVVALAVIGVTIWFWRNTVPDPEALESLAFFEERVVDGSEDADTVQRRRPALSEREPIERGRLHLPHRNRVDRGESSEEPHGDRRRRHGRG
jgi:hypothetical protein